MEGSEYGSTAKTMNTCPAARATSVSIARKCQYLAQAKPPSRSASGASDTGFQMATPVTTSASPTHGMVK